MDTADIKPTNLMPCYARSFMDIPFSQEFSDAVNAERARDLFVNDNPIEYFVSFMESRYKAIDELIKRNNINQIIELAAGWSPRGLIMTKDSKINYIETDQDPKEIKQKIVVTKELVGETRANLHCLLLDVVTGEGISNVEDKLHSAPVCIVHEGLFRYFSHDLKTKTVKNIISILRKHGSVYITPDIYTDVRTAEMNKVVNVDKINSDHSQSTGVDIRSNEFKDITEAKKFFTDLGLDVKMYKQGELVSDFSCVNHPSLNKKLLVDIIEVVKRRDIFEMSLIN